MRIVTVHVLLLFLAQVTVAQTSLLDIDLEFGKHKVGFRHYTKTDSTRTYSRVYDYNNINIARPIPISLWYPVEGNRVIGEPLKVLDYFEILKEEEEWEDLPNEQILNWFYYPNTSANQKHLAEQTAAYTHGEFGHQKFPVIVYAPSYQASSIENFALCEFLASHGYVVISSPSRGTENRWFSNNNPKEMETQARDVEFLIAEAMHLPNSIEEKIAVMGFSFGGLSNVITQNRNKHVKGIVSLDGTERYQYGLLSKSPFFHAKNIDVPYLHMAQKEIPEKVLKEDNIDAALNDEFQLYDSLSKSQAYQLKFNNLTHSYFSSLGVLFADRDSRQDKSDTEIMESYKLVSNYALNFLNAVLKNDKTSLKFMTNKPSANGIAAGLIGYKTKEPAKEQLTFQDFNELASGKNYENLAQLYESLKKDHPAFEIPEANLNTLGLQLVFNPKTSQQGIDVFLFATRLYPNSANLFDSLAEGYLYMDKKEKAIESFEKSLVLNPNNQNAIMRLKELGK